MVRTTNRVVRSDRQYHHQTGKTKTITHTRKGTFYHAGKNKTEARYQTRKGFKRKF